MDLWRPFAFLGISYFALHSRGWRSFHCALTLSKCSNAVVASFVCFHINETQDRATCSCSSAELPHFGSCTSLTTYKKIYDAEFLFIGTLSPLSRSCNQKIPLAGILAAKRDICIASKLPQMFKISPQSSIGVCQMLFIDLASLTPNLTLV